MPKTSIESDNPLLTPVKTALVEESQRLGFADCRVTGLDIQEHGKALDRWLALNYQADMSYMSRHRDLRQAPEQLVPGALRCVSVRMNYWPPEDPTRERLENPETAYISRYALGRDYHKVMRKRLGNLGKFLQRKLEGTQFRAFVDSAPVLERGFAREAGLGWIGKNTMLIHPRAGSYFFLGEILTDAPLPVDDGFTDQHCGSCRACLDLCPTDAFPEPHVLDANRCISYLTIENRGPIPEAFRKPMGNRVFGCDDCQLVCPWNKFAQFSQEADFKPRHQLDNSRLSELFLWTEAQFLERTEGSPIRRTGYEGWLRNLAVGLGNAPGTPEVISALKSRRKHPSQLVRIHVRWALKQHGCEH